MRECWHVPTARFNVLPVGHRIAEYSIYAVPELEVSVSDSLRIDLLVRVILQSNTSR